MGRVRTATELKCMECVTREVAELWKPCDRIMKTTPVSATKLLHELRERYNTTQFRLNLRELGKLLRGEQSEVGRANLRLQVADLMSSVLSEVVPKYGFVISHQLDAEVWTEVAVHVKNGDELVQYLQTQIHALLDEKVTDRVKLMVSDTHVDLESVNWNVCDVHQDEIYSRADWCRLLEKCEDFRESHQQQSAPHRHGASWARTMAFCRIKLGASSVALRRGSAERPFIFWVLGCTEEVELELAENAWLDDINFVDNVATEVVLWGRRLRDISTTVDAAREGQAPFFRTARYETISSAPRPWIREIGVSSPRVSPCSRVAAAGDG